MGIKEHAGLTDSAHLCRFENAEMRSVVLSDDDCSSAHPDPLHFHGGIHAVD